MGCCECSVLVLVVGGASSGFCAKSSLGGAEVANPSGVKTAHKKPTSRPDEHSCRNAIISQNSSRLRTLRHLPGRLPFDGLSLCFLESGGGSVSSSSSSSTKRDLGSSGKRGIRHRSGALAGRLRRRRGSREGCHCARRVGEWRTWGGKKERCSWRSQPGTRRYACAVLLVFFSSSWEVACKTGSITRHHHLINPLSSSTCFPEFSMLPGKRYWSCARAKRETTSCLSFR